MLEWEVGAMKVQRAWPIKEGALSQLPPVLLCSATNVVNCFKCSELQTQLMSVGQDFTFYSPSMLPTQKTFSKRNLSKFRFGKQFYPNVANLLI